MANNNKQMVDLPVFELCNQIPVTTGALGGTTTVTDGTGRYIYYLQTSSFYRYDKIADTWQQLANPPTAAATVGSLKYTSFRGFHGRIISSTSTDVTIPGLRSGVFNSETIKITDGTGAGQERTLSFVSETIHDAGVITTVNGTASITDSLKKWRSNQWAGYTLALSFGTGVTQFKKVLYNNANTLFVNDTNLQKHDPWNNNQFWSTAPYAVPVAYNTHYKIISSTYSVDSPWNITPDSTSTFTITTGGIYLLSSAGSTPFFTLQYYDIANDMWQTKTVSQNLISATLGTDASIERLARLGIAHTTNVGTVSVPSNRTLRDIGQNFATNDRYANYRIEITGGTGRGQTRRIVGHTTNTYTIERNWDTNPDGTSTYTVWTDYDKLYFAPGGLSALFAYSIDNDSWMQGHSFDVGIANTIGAGYTTGSYATFGVSSGAIIASGIRTINPTPTVAGTGYAVGDVAICNTGGTGAQVRVTGVGTTGGVTSLELIHSGTATGFTVGTGRATTQTGGLGSGSGLTIEITSVGETALVTTNSAHLFKSGEVVGFSGCTNASWNGNYTVLGVPLFTTTTAPNTLCVVSNVGAAMTASSTQSTTVIVDSSKNWITNEHVGRLVQLNVAGTAPTSQIRWITANTAKTLTIQGTITAAANGTSNYMIYDSKLFGVDIQRKEDGMQSYGYATSGTTTSLVDSTKSWIPNQWANYFFKVEAGTGYGSGRILITSNTATTLTFATQTFTPDTTTKYEIADCWGLMSASTTTSITEATNKNWAVAQWAQKRVKISAGTGVGQEVGITTNTATVLTTGTITAGDTSSAYAILAPNTRGAGIELMFNYGSTDSTKKGRYLYTARGGGSPNWEIFDLTTGRWITVDFTYPQSELWTTGSSYCYDGADTIYATRSATGAVARIFRYNINNNEFDGSMTSTFLQGTVHVGNYMTILKDPTTEYEYLYIMQNGGTLMTRALLF